MQVYLSLFSNSSYDCGWRGIECQFLSDILFHCYLYYYLFLLAATQTGSSLITGLLTAITPERLWGTYGSSK